MSSSIVELIAKTRDGLDLQPADVRAIVDGFCRGEVADYQLTAWLMAVYLRGISDAATVALTEAMLHSGTVVDLSSVKKPKVDKHSTGGVGDKISICLAPMVAAAGVPVPMVSGRGLGHTGGTLDKLEAIPGFSTELSIADFTRIVGEIGTSMIGQTKDIAPADKRIYALRDVTATVESIPLIVASILSKKLAEGIDGLVLDVKVGRGAFMKDEARARALAEALVRVGTGAGKQVVAVLTRMDAPLGQAVGNANETREAIEVLHGQGPADVVECTLVLGAEMLLIGGAARTIEEAREKLEKVRSDGRGLSTFRRMVEAHGGDPRVVDDPTRLAMAEKRVDVKAAQAGFVTGIDAFAVGMLGVSIGAGRTRADQKVDPGVGIELMKKPGDAVQVGDVLATLVLREHNDEAASVERLQSAYTVDAVAPAALPLVVATLGR